MRKVNEECKSCAITNTSRGRVDKACWTRACYRRRSYYRRHDANKRSQTERHRYLKYKSGKCGLCGSGECLEVHHIIPQSKSGLDARFNTITLCHVCHKTISKYYRAIGWH